MYIPLASRIMPRTTIDIDAQVLRDLKDRQERDGKSLGQLVSELVAGALRDEAEPSTEAFTWTTSRMRARVDLTDKDAVFRALDER